MSNIVQLPQHAVLRTLTTKEASRHLGISHRTLEHWRLVGGGPRFMKVGRSVRYPISELEAFMARPLFSNTAQAKAA